MSVLSDAWKAITKIATSDYHTTVDKAVTTLGSQVKKAFVPSTQQIKTADVVGQKIKAIGAELTAVHPDISQVDKILKAPAEQVPSIAAQIEQQRTAAEKKEFEAAPSVIQRALQFGGAVKTGLTGAEQPEYQTKTAAQPWTLGTAPGKIADLVTNLVGMGVGFFAGGELLGATKAGKAAAITGEKLIPWLATTEGKKLIPKVASEIVKGAVRGGVETEMLSGVHSVLNAETHEEALERAKEYGLMGIIGGGAAGGLELLGAIAKKLKPIVKDSAVAEHIKGYTPTERTPVPVGKEETLASAKATLDDFDNVTPEIAYKASNVFQDIIHNADNFPKTMVQEAKENLLRLHDLAEDRYKLEISRELTPSGEPIKPERPELTPREVPAGKTVQATGLNGETRKVKIEPIEGKPDEFWMQSVDSRGKVIGEKTWGKTDYWTLRTIPKRAAKLKAPTAVPTEVEAAPVVPTEVAPVTPTEVAPMPIGTRPGTRPRMVLPAEEQARLFPGVEPISTTPPRLRPPETTGKKVQNFLDMVYKNMVDASRPIEKLSKETGNKEFMLATNLKSSSGISRYIFETNLVGKGKEIVGGSLKSVVEGRLPESPEGANAFWKAFISKYAPKKGMNAGVILRFRTETMPSEFMAVGEDLAKWLDTFAKSWDTPPEQIYRRLIEITPEGELSNPLELLLKTIDKTVRTEKYNEILVELVKSVKENPEKLKDIVEDVSKVNTANMKNLLKVKMSKNITAELHIKDDNLYQSFMDLMKVAGEPSVFQKVVQFMKNILTIKNPFFAFRNIFKDIPSALIKSEDPIALLKELPKAAKEAFGPKGLYESVGGGEGMFFRTEGAKTLKELAGGPRKVTILAPFEKFGDNIAWFNEALESIPRRAEFNRVLKETGDLDKALFAANDITVNFSRGGKWAKSIDEVVPYFNAGVQGLDNFIRTFSSPGKALSTLVKGGIAITTPKIVQWVVNHNNPNYEKLDNTTKDNYFIIPVGDAKTTEKFIKIPASREFNALFGAFAQRALSKDGFKGFFDEQGKQMLPPNPLGENIFSGVMGSMSNWDFYFEHPIISQAMTLSNVPKRLQFDETTNKLIVKLSQFVYDKTGQEFSPMMAEYLIREYTGELGQIVVGLTGGEVKKGLKVATGKWTADTLKDAQPINDFYDLMDKVAEDYSAAKITKATNVNSLKAMNSDISKASTAISNLRKDLKDLDPSDPKVRDIQRQMIAIAEGIVNKYGEADTKAVGGAIPTTGGRSTTKAKVSGGGGGGGGGAKKATTSARLKAPATAGKAPTTTGKAPTSAAAKYATTLPPTTKATTAPAGGSVLSQYVGK